MPRRLQSRLAPKSLEYVKQRLELCWPGGSMDCIAASGALELHFVLSIGKGVK
jgi:hypothetical protein